MGATVRSRAHRARPRGLALPGPRSHGPTVAAPRAGGPRAEVAVHVRGGSAFTSPGCRAACRPIGSACTRARGSRPACGPAGSAFTRADGDRSACGPIGSARTRACGGRSACGPAGSGFTSPGVSAACGPIGSAFRRVAGGRSVCGPAGSAFTRADGGRSACGRVGSAFTSPGCRAGVRAVPSSAAGGPAVACPARERVWSADTQPRAALVAIVESPRPYGGLNLPRSAPTRRFWPSHARRRPLDPEGAPHRALRATRRHTASILDLSRSRSGKSPR